MAKSTSVKLLSGEVVVETKSAWYSKINWTQAIAMLAMIGTSFGLFDMTAETQASVLSGIIAIQAGATWAFKTFFTSTITPASVPPTIITE